MLQRLLQNHVLANLLFVLVLVVGALSYRLMPRQQGPTINYNWIDITTLMPGASASDIEKRVTNVLEEAVRKVSDIRFVTSTSREGQSNIVVRFDGFDERVFDKRVGDLRRELQNKERELPEEVDDPIVTEITTANGFPSATVLVTSPGDDENLRRQAEIIKKGIERIKGVDRISALGLAEPELQVNFLPDELQGLGISPTDLADTVRAHYRDIAAGSLRVNDQTWLVRMIGTDREPGYLAELPVLTGQGEVRLGRLAEVKRGRDKPTQLARYNDRPAVLLAITKQGDANVLQLVQAISAYVDERNAQSAATGVKLILADDRTQTTRDALDVMQTNAVLGLLLVLLVTWLFVGFRMALFTCLGIPFVLAGTFWILRGTDQTLNVSVLLGVVISLGMLVDDAVVVMEAIYYRLQRGMAALQAAGDALREVFAPVTTAVLTTMAAFLPLMLLPGILGQFMLVIPLVVTLALAVSLIEAYWMLPAHVVAAKVSFARPSRVQNLRVKALRRIRITYTRLLIKVMRRPVITFAGVALVFVLSLGAVFGGFIKLDFFASDPVRLFYVNVQMPAGTPLPTTLDKVLEVEETVRGHVRDGEARAITSYAGKTFSRVTAFVGDHYGQILVALNPMRDGLRNADEMIDAMRSDLERIPGTFRLSFRRLAGGPPVSNPISIKVRGEKLDEIRRAADDLKEIMRSNPAIRDISDDAAAGQMQLGLRVDMDAARRAGINPDAIARSVRLFVDGEVVASMQDRGEKLELRVRAKPTHASTVDALLQHTLPSAAGNVPLRTLLQPDYGRGVETVRHHNFRRAITVQADIDKTQIDTVAANQMIRDRWEELRGRYPDIDLDFSGALDDIKESLDAIGVLFLFGIGLIYLILGTQFKSYLQPLMVLASVPMAFTGVVLGLLVTRHPLSLYTLYGVVALAGIAVNSAIVLISAANARLADGMSVAHATLYAARRRVIPILITSLTTIAGLFSLATGLGGHSLLWGPVATAIVWGLGFSSVLTLFVVPLLYRLCMRRAQHRLPSEAIAVDPQNLDLSAYLSWLKTDAANAPIGAVITPAEKIRTREYEDA